MKIEKYIMFCLLSCKIQMRKKELAIFLSGLRGFAVRKESLEQRESESEIIADVLWKAYMLGDIEGKIIADLGCGTGIIGIGCLLLRAKKVYFVDIDEDAIKVLKENLSKLEGNLRRKAVIILKDVSKLSKKDVKNVEVVIQNPPFGVKKRLDRIFLEVAFKMVNVVYSFHRLDVERFVYAFSWDHGFKVTHLWKYKWPMKAVARKHRKRIRYLPVGCWRLERFLK
ncbi:MAG TPA: methyltransferase domain-containing protein [Candidatus Woesearchaeota archaeon]|nr:methyltransferase domain-containing protein [Candidatus Woesearchaeota archaeon]